MRLPQNYQIQYQTQLKLPRSKELISDVVFTQKLYSVTLQVSLLKKWAQQNSIIQPTRCVRESRKGSGKIDLQGHTKHHKVNAEGQGVIQSIKGKMYCLKLGEVAQFKEFSHYFYTSQYRRKLSKPQSAVKGKEDEPSLRRTAPKITTQPSQYLDDDARLGSDNSEQIRRLHYGENEEVGILRVDNRMKQKINKFLLPVINNEGSPSSVRRQISSKASMRKSGNAKIL